MYNYWHIHITQDIPEVLAIRLGDLEGVCIMSVRQ